MIDKLKRFEDMYLMDLLASNDVWDSLDIDYHPPYVKRVYIQLDEDFRILLHEIHPCHDLKALLHPHPWEAAMHVLPIGGIYEHGMGYSDGEEQTIVCTQEVHGEMYYEMMSSNSIHYVNPINGPVYTIMLTGDIKWPENNHKATKKLGPLEEKEKERILGIFRKYYKIKKPNKYDDRMMH